jgi:hypothetical protein
MRYSHQKTQKIFIYMVIFCHFTVKEFDRAKTHQRLNIAVNSVFAIVCPVSAHSMESRSAIGWVMSMSTAYNVNT